MDDESESRETHTLKIEAEEVVKEVKFAVKFVEISTHLPQSNEQTFMNIQTKEGNKYCVELSVQGFKIVGKQFDCQNASEFSRYYETIYALLDTVSPEYRNSFGETLLQKLQTLQQTNDEEHS